MKSMLKALSAVALTTVMVLPVLADDTTSDANTDAKDQKDPQEGHRRSGH